MQQCAFRDNYFASGLNHLQGFFEAAGRGIVERQFLVVMSFRTHPHEQVVQDSLLARQQILFKATAEVEAVDREGFPDQV